MIKRLSGRLLLGRIRATLAQNHALLSVPSPKERFPIMKYVVLATAVALSAAAPAPLFAQEAPAESPAAFSDTDVASFAKAAVKVQIISQEAQEKMIQAIESTEGLSIDTYNAIVQASQTDPELAAKITELMQAYAMDAGITTTE